MTKLVPIALCLCALMLTACTERKPQQPSQWRGKEVKVDSAQLALLELNQKMVVTADDLLLQYVQTMTDTYAMYETNAWIYFIDRGDMDTPAPQSGDTWNIHLKVYSLEDQKLLIDCLRQYRIGKNELPKAIDSNISEFRIGTKARMLAPWYSAYGMQGTQQVPPYENVIIEIEIKE